MGTVLLLDTSSAIAFIEEMRRPDLLEALIRLGYRVELPRKVVDELKSEETVKVLDKMKDVRFLGRAEISITVTLENRYPALGGGEIEVLARAAQLESESAPYRCVLDDARARKVACRLGRPVTGTVGLLNELVEAGILNRSERESLLRELRRKGFRYAGE